MEAIEFGKKPPKDSMKTYLSVFGNGLKRKNELRTLNAEILKLESEVIKEMQLILNMNLLFILFETCLFS